VILTGEQATKDELLAQLPRASYVHLATHGFFFNQQTIEHFQSNSEQGAVKSTAMNAGVAGGAPLHQEEIR